ncbi:Uncharacterised protein [Mycobacterium tuberculosis]|nr:Uncharacterised protein [Mycobacterium tuberculosis]
MSLSLSRTGLDGSNKSIPLSAMVIPRAAQRFPGPRASATARTVCPRRDVASSAPSSMAAALSSTAAAVPSGPHATLAQTWIPWLR